MKELHTHDDSGTFLSRM